MPGIAALSSPGPGAAVEVTCPVACTHSNAAGDSKGWHGRCAGRRMGPFGVGKAVLLAPAPASSGAVWAASAVPWGRGWPAVQVLQSDFLEPCRVKSALLGGSSLRIKIDWSSDPSLP